MYNLSPFISDVEAIVASHNLGRPGAYRRWRAASQAGSTPRDLGLNPYGCADAANILYTIGRFPRDSAERAAWVATLQSLQDPASGLFREPTHHEIHTTAHCIAALELFDAAPRHVLEYLLPLADPDLMTAFLDNLNWTGNPWSESHKGAGLYVSLVLANEVTPAWQDRYFDWLWEHSDPATGFLRRGCVGPAQAGATRTIFPHLAGTFHYLFNMQYARRPLRYPEAVIDTCLDLLASNVFPLGASVGFAEIDWVYCVTRSLRQCGHRFADCRAALTAFAQQYTTFLLSLDPATHDGLNDLHSLFGALCALAELQQSLPGLIRTTHPLKLVLDRRPFI
jgi:hypothetical protein